MRRTVLTLGVLAAVSAAAWLVLTRHGFQRSGRVNVLLISLDTMRADRLGSYGYAAGRTPNLDALAARGTRFEQAMSVAALTLPAHASLMTGTFPSFHGIRDNGGFYMEEGQTTLAEALREQGYRTGAFVGAFVLDARWGLNQGFEEYFDEFDLSDANGTGMDSIQRRGDAVVDRSLTWLGEHADQPFFAWVHLYDAHTPYAAPEPFRSQFPATTSGAYDAEVAFTDAQVGRMLQHLEDKDLAESTIVVVIGDHGESLGDHREQTHGFFLYDSSIHIPLIVAGPGVSAGVVRDQVRIVDVSRRCWTS
jgi:arylsulfatase A-like enzyme